jgi:hypothetical protein
VLIKMISFKVVRYVATKTIFQKLLGFFYILIMGYLFKFLLVNLFTINLGETTFDWKQEN